jgi:hypothetical protein
LESLRPGEHMSGGWLLVSARLEPASTKHGSIRCKKVRPDGSALLLAVRADLFWTERVSPAVC